LSADYLTNDLGYNLEEDCFYDEYFYALVCEDADYCEAEWNLFYATPDAGVPCLDACEYGIDYSSCEFK